MHYVETSVGQKYGGIFRHPKPFPSHEEAQAYITDMRKAEAKADLSHFQRRVVSADG